LENEDKDKIFFIINYKDDVDDVDDVDDIFVYFPSKKQFVMSIAKTTGSVKLEDFLHFIGLDEEDHKSAVLKKLVVDIYYPPHLQQEIQKCFKTYQNQLIANNYWVVGKQFKEDH
jgi:hypothetical protein